MIAMILAECGVVWWLLFGCPAEPAMPVTNTLLDIRLEEQRTEQRLAVIQATVTANQERERTERHVITQQFLNDRFAWQERETTTRLFYVVVWLVIATIIAGIVAGLRAILVQRQEVAVTVTLPPIPRELPYCDPQRFRLAAEDDGWQGWEVVEDEWGRTVGVHQLASGGHKMYLLKKDNNHGN